MEKILNKNESLKSELTKLFGEQEENIENAAHFLKVMSHPARLRILCALRDGEQTVQNLEYYTGIRQTTLSQHLSLLKNRGVLSSRRESTYSLYRFSNEKIMGLFDLIREVFCPWVLNKKYGKNEKVYFWIETIFW